MSIADYQTFGIIQRPDGAVDVLDHCSPQSFENRLDVGAIESAGLEELDIVLRGDCSS